MLMAICIFNKLSNDHIMILLQCDESLLFLYPLVHLIVRKKNIFVSLLFCFFVLLLLWNGA